MKLALCLEYPLGLRGGVSVLVEALLEGLAGSGNEVILVSPDTAETLARSSAGRLARRHFPWNPQASPDEARQLAHRLAAEKPDVAHFHSGGNYGWKNRFANQSPIVHLNRLGVPCLFTGHLVVGILDGYCDPKRPAWFKLLMLPLVWRGKLQQLRHSRFEIAVSRHDLRKLERWYWPRRNRFVQIYHSRLRQDAAAPPPARRERIILNVGHLAWRKGQAVLAEAFARIASRFPDWTLQLAGHYAEREIADRIQSLARRHGLADRIQLLGEQSDPLELMRRSAIYVQPSFWEALGLALQEAMFCGCAVIGSRAGGIPELIESDQSGFLVEPGDVAALSVTLERLMRDETTRERFGRAAADSIRQRGMTFETMIKRHLDLYDQVGRNSRS